MQFKEKKSIDEQALVALYASVGWTAYTNDRKRLVRGVEQSLTVITAWQEKELIGLIRSVGDGETILYIQDLLVKPAYQNRGIGTALMKKMEQTHPDIRQKLLLTENTVATKKFYEKVGFYPVEEHGSTCLYKEY